MNNNTHKNLPSLETLLSLALKEDCPQDDLTTDFFLPHNSLSEALLIAKEPGIFYGEEVMTTLFDRLGFPQACHFYKKNADKVSASDLICQLKAPLKTMLLAERVMLNFIQRLSGIATTTHAFVTALNNPKIAVLDTRKTTPLFRELERKAVVAGGGHNHRFCLSDMVLLKENHLTEIEKAGKLSQLHTLMSQFKAKYPDKKIEIEIETLDQLKTLDLSLADIIMFDNFSPENIEPGVAICKERNFNALIEISGNVTLQNIHTYAHFPIDRISVGSLTHSPKALDLSLLCQ